VGQKFSTSKFLVPVTLLLWLILSISIAQAQPTQEVAATGDPNTECLNSRNWSEFVQDPSPSHLRLVNPCVTAQFEVVGGQYWRNSGRDGDYNHYGRCLLGDNVCENLQTLGGRDGLREWDPTRSSDVHLEVIPHDQSAGGTITSTPGGGIPSPCFDKDGDQVLYPGQGGEIPAWPPCNTDPNPLVEVTGAHVLDVRWNWREVHPIVRMRWDTDRDGTWDGCESRWGTCTATP
jgi:hypothetical protein